MNDLQNKYDELDEIILGIDNIIDNISNKYYIDMLSELKFEAQTEQEEVEEKLQEQYDREETEMNMEFERSRL